MNTPAPPLQDLLPSLSPQSEHTLRHQFATFQNSAKRLALVRFYSRSLQHASVLLFLFSLQPWMQSLWIASFLFSMPLVGALWLYQRALLKRHDELFELFSYHVRITSPPQVDSTFFTYASLLARKVQKLSFIQRTPMDLYLWALYAHYNQGPR